MNLSCRFSSTKHAASPPFLFKTTSPFFPRHSHSHHVKPIPLPPPLSTNPSSLGILRFRDFKLSHPFAALSSFAEGDEEGKKEGTPDATENGELGGIAKAFNISSRTASAISICMALAVLTFPLFMTSLGQGLTLKTKVLSYATLLFGFYMAWNIGANDVANAMGTSVGSGALTLRQAVLTAAVLEFSGALMMGTHVTSTMQKGILVANVFNGKDSLLFAGLLSSLAAAGTWLQFASYYGWPVSTTHCIVGAMVGFGLAYGGAGAVFWGSLARVISSWVVSPLMGAAVSFLVYKCIRRFVYSAPNPGQAAAAAAPIAVFLGVTGISFVAFPLSKTFALALAQALAVGTVGAFLVDRIIRKQLGHLLVKSNTQDPEPKEDTAHHSIGFLDDVAGPKGAQLEIVYGVFGYMQVLSACFMSFAHGGNDVSNSIGPLAGALAILQGGAAGTEIVIPTDVLAWGGFGIVAGLMMWGYRVIATIGKKITELTPTRGFAAEFAAASVVLFASKLGLPISATHTLVGAVMGVGFARGLNSVRSETVKEIVASWVVTIPVGATLSVLYTWILTKILFSDNIGKPNLLHISKRDQDILVTRHQNLFMPQHRLELRVYTPPDAHPHELSSQQSHSTASTTLVAAAVAAATVCFLSDGSSFWNLSLCAPPGLTSEPHASA
ncbi:Inorganic phosphate transporter 2-1, chloroplastic, partial [Mucuna pruriens]